MHAHSGSSRDRGGEILQLHPLSPMPTTTTKRLSPNTTALSREGETVVSGIGMGRRNSVSATAVNGHGSGSGSGAGMGSNSGNSKIASSGTNGRKRSGTATGRSTSPTSSRKPLSTPSTTVPAKRKQPSSPSGSINALPGPSSPLLDASDPDTIRCICGYTIDDGWSIGCDGCSRWVHGVCFGIEMKDKERLPERWWCWECDVGNPNFGKGYFDRLWGEGGLEKARERAREIQGRRLAGADARNNGKKRMSSPGVERTKSRKPSSLTIQPPDSHSNKRKRTSNGNGPSPLTTTATTPLTSFSSFPFPPTSSSYLHPNGHSSNSSQHSNKPNSSGKQSHSSSHLNSTSGSEEIDIDDFSMDLPSSIDLTQAHDIIPHAETREHLRKQAAEWRGISAISQPLPSTNLATTPVYLPAQHGVPTPVSLRPLPLGSQPSSILPPTFSVHTTHSIPSHTLLTPFPSVITPSSEYLKDPLNGYSLLGMPKPRVHLVGPPLDVCLDARGGPSYSKSHIGEREKGGSGKASAASGADVKGNGAGAPFGKFVRSGCRPNAVLRPVLCDRRASSASTPSAHRSKESEKGAQKEKRRDMGKARERDEDEDEDETTLSFAIFALRDLKEGEEVVLGWEWDDANVVHLLPALLEGRGVFPPSQLHSYKLQMSNILRALSATFATCACGEPTTEANEGVTLGSSDTINGNGCFDEKIPGAGSKGLGVAGVYDQGRGRRLGGCVIRRMKEFVEGVYDCDEREKGKQPWSEPSIRSRVEPQSLETLLLDSRKQGERNLGRGHNAGKGHDEDQEIMGQRYRGLQGSSKVHPESDISKDKANVVQDGRDSGEDVNMTDPGAAPMSAPASSSLDFILNRVDEPIPRPLPLESPCLSKIVTHDDSIPYSNPEHSQSTSAHYSLHGLPSQFCQQPQSPLHHHRNHIHTAPRPGAIPTPATPRTINYSAAPTQREHDLGPLIGVPRGFRTRERIPGSGGWGGAEMDLDADASVGPRAIASYSSPLPIHTPLAVPTPNLTSWASTGREMFPSLPSSPEYGYSLPQFSHFYSHAPFIPTMIHPNPPLIPYYPYQHGQPYLHPYAQSHDYPYGIPPSQFKRHRSEQDLGREIQYAQDRRDRDDETSLYWGRAPLRGERSDNGKGKRSVEAIDEQEKEGDIEVEVEIEIMGSEDDEDGLGLDYTTQPQPQRHRRKRSVNPHRRRKLSVEGTSMQRDVEVEVAAGVEEAEVPPKMKRRITQLKKELGGVSEVMVVDNDPNNQSGDKDKVSISVTSDSPPVPSPPMSTIPRISIDNLSSHSTTALNAGIQTRIQTEMDVSSARNDSSASPLMSLANLSLLSPAIPLPGSALGMKPRLGLMTKDLWSESQSHSPPPSTPFGITASPRKSSKSPTSDTVPVAIGRRSEVTDPLAALAAAAAAARPISPKSKRGEWDKETEWDRERWISRSKVLRSRSPAPKSHHPSNLRNNILSPQMLARRSISPMGNEITRYTHDQQQYRSQSREALLTQAHDAVLGPGGIRVLSSPQHAWASLRSSVSSMSTSVSDDVSSERRIAALTRSSSNMDMALEGFGRDEASSSIPRSVHSPFLDHGDESTSLEVKLEMVEEAEGWYGEDSHHLNGVQTDVIDLVSSPIRDSGRVSDRNLMQFDDDNDQRNSPLPRRRYSRSSSSRSHSNSNSASSAQSYIAPLSPPSPPPQNLGEIAPWPSSPSPSLSLAASVSGSPKSRPRSSSGLVRERSLSKSYCPRTPSLVNETFSLPMHPPAVLSPVFHGKDSVGANEKGIIAVAPGDAMSRKRTITPSPLSSPLSSPMENLISLPAHSAPPAAIPSPLAENSIQMEIDGPKANARPRLTTPSDVPALDHSNSVSPSPDNISPTTPPEHYVESEAGGSTEPMNTDEGVVVPQEDTYEVKDQQIPPSTLASVDAFQVPVSSPDPVEVNGQPMTEHSEAPASLAATTTVHSSQMPTTSLPAVPSTPITAPSKVKMSLKDFALRKRRQKEEEQREKEEKEQKDVSKEVLEPGKGYTEVSHPIECSDLASGTAVTKDALEAEATLPERYVPLHISSAEWKVEDYDRKQSQSDVDMILKASETLNKLMVTSKTSTMSKMINGDTKDLSTSFSTLSHETVLSASPDILRRASITSSSAAPPTRLTLSPPSSLSRMTTETSPKASYNLKHVRRSSHEDGEIIDTDDQASFSFSAPPSLPPDTKTALSPVLTSIPKSYSPPPRSFKFPDTTNIPNEQRSRTPPTQPRSFVSRSPSVSSLPHGSPPSQSMGLNGNNSILPSTSISATSSAPVSITAPAVAVTSVNSALGRTPPSGPRALRQLQQRQDTGGRGFSGDRSGFISRGPGTPYDPRDRDRFRDRGARDRDRDRDRDWSINAPRIRAREGGWGR